MNTVNLTINGKLVQAEKGSTIMEVALANGVKIPHLCYEKGLSIAGTCRVCMVKIKGRPGMEAACTTEVVEGMKVITSDEEIDEARKLIVELILSEHKHDCLV
ncbi:unnamed protein product, partial [marine sediment metagenome]